MRTPPVLRRRSVRMGATVAVVAILVVSAFVGGRQTDTLRSERDSAGAAAQTNADSVGEAGKILADVCSAATDKRIKATGRDRACQLAKQGKIDQVVPVITPQITVERVSQKDIEQVVDAYLSDYLTDLPAKYRTDLRQSVVDYLAANPPAAGKDGKPGPAPTSAAIGAVVASYLTAHPPLPGKDGTPGTPGGDGVSVTGAALDGCDVVFSLSNDTTVKVGPICGPKGEAGRGPTADELRAAFDSYCADQPGGTCRGADGTPGYPTGWRGPDGSVCTDPDGDRFYTCEAPPAPSSPPPSTPGVPDPPVSVPTG